MASLSNSSIDRLGDSIRVDSTSGYQEILLNGLRVEWARAASEVAGRIQSNPLLGQFDISWREKHLGTIRAKLKRQETARLSQIRDVAGCRVVIAAGRQSQKAVVDELQREFGSSVRKTINYLEKSQLGYRAIHLELLHNGVLVEIQVRTQLQHRAALRHPLAIWGRIRGSGICMTLLKDLIGWVILMQWNIWLEKHQRLFMN